MAKLTSLKPFIKTLAPRLSGGRDTWREGRSSSTQRGYDYRWQQARLEHLAEHPCCVYCDEQGIVTAATVVDHKVPHRGDRTLFWDRANWQSLCATCHSGRKQREEAAG